MDRTREKAGVIYVCTLPQMIGRNFQDTGEGKQVCIASLYTTIAGNRDDYTLNKDIKCVCVCLCVSVCVSECM